MNSKFHSLEELHNKGYVKLGRGNVISRKDLVNNKGNFPVYSSSSRKDGKFGEYNKHMFDEELITWSVDGGGNLFHREKHKFSITNVSGFIRILRKDLIDYKYLYYLLTYFHSRLKFDWVKKAHPSIIDKLYNNIFLPSLQNQKEIAKKIYNKSKIIETLYSELISNIIKSNNLLDLFIKEKINNSGKIYSLGEICKIIGGGTPSKKVKRFYDGNINWATVRDMKFDLLEKTTYKISKEGLLKSSSNLISKNNVVISSRVGLGKVCFILEDTAINQDLRGIIPKNPEKLYPMYIFYFFKSIKDIIITAGRGATVHGVKLPFLKSLKIPLPKLTIQKNIISDIENIKFKVSKINDLINHNLNNLKSLKNVILRKYLILK